jgi:hypothetical protein
VSRFPFTILFIEGRGIRNAVTITAARSNTLTLIFRIPEDSITRDAIQKIEKKGLSL